MTTLTKIPTKTVAPEGSVKHTRDRKPKGVGVNKSEPRIAYLMLLPVVAGLAIFVLWPLVRAVYLSFFQWNFYGHSKFVAWQNFEDVLTDPKFLQSVLTGLMFTVLVVPASLIIAFLFASFVKAIGGRLASVLKVTIYIPTVVSGVIASLIFGVIYQYSGGILNWFVGLFGVSEQAWVGDAKWALQAVAVPTIWIGIGLTALIMLSSLLDIPPSYYEAAQLEGCGWFKQQRYITIPLMKNIYLYLLITGFCGAIQQLDIPLVMTGGGPLDSTTLPNLFIFNHFRNDQYVGYSVAASLLLFIVIGSISALVFRLLRSEKAIDA